MEHVASQMYVARAQTQSRCRDEVLFSKCERVLSATNSLVGVFMYESNFSVVKKDSDRSALVNVKARPTDNPTPHTYTTSFHSYDMVVSVALEHVCSHYLCFEGRPSQAGALKS